jgi:hypothetical protein
MAPSGLALEGKMYAFRNDLVGYLVRPGCAAAKCWVTIAVVQQGAMLPLCGCADVVPTMLILGGDVALSTRVRQRIWHRWAVSEPVACCSFDLSRSDFSRIHFAVKVVVLTNVGM